MVQECERWLKECKKAFPKLRRYAITCKYTKVPKNILGRIKGKIAIKRELDPEKLLLYGRTEAKTKRKIGGNFEIEINPKLRKVRKYQLRKQIGEYVIVHELLHLENKDLLTLSKEYRRRKVKKIHKGEFEDQVLERFNKVRELNKLPKIKSKKDLKIAINKILAPF